MKNSLRFFITLRAWRMKNCFVQLDMQLHWWNHFSDAFDDSIAVRNIDVYPYSNEIALEKVAEVPEFYILKII